MSFYSPRHPLYHVYASKDKNAVSVFIVIGATLAGLVIPLIAIKASEPNWAMIADKREKELDTKKMFAVAIPMAVIACGASIYLVNKVNNLKWF